MRKPLDIPEFAKLQSNIITITRNWDIATGLNILRKLERTENWILSTKSIALLSQRNRTIKGLRGSKIIINY